MQGYKGRGQQYASHTVENLDTVKVTQRVRDLAIRLLLFGSIRKDIIYQSMQPGLGTVVEVIDGEYFAK